MEGREGQLPPLVQCEVELTESYRDRDKAGEGQGRKEDGAVQVQAGGEWLLALPALSRGLCYAILSAVACNPARSVIKLIDAELRPVHFDTFGPIFADQRTRLTNPACHIARYPAE